MVIIKGPLRTLMTVPPACLPTIFGIGTQGAALPASRIRDSVFFTRPLNVSLIYYQSLLSGPFSYSGNRYGFIADGMHVHDIKFFIQFSVRGEGYISILTISKSNLL